MKYKFGSNYVPAEIAVSMKEEEKNRGFIGTVDNYLDYLGNAKEEYNQKYKRIWLFHTYPCQKNDFFGAKLYAVT